MNARQALAVEAVKDLLTRNGESGSEITFAWISDEYKQRGLTQHDLKNLAKCGALQKTDDARGGHRAYYRTTDHAVWK